MSEIRIRNVPKNLQEQLKRLSETQQRTQNDILIEMMTNYFSFHDKRKYLLNQELENLMLQEIIEYNCQLLEILIEALEDTYVKN